MPQTDEDLLDEVSDAWDDGTLMTPKHDPKGVGSIWSSYRSVLSEETVKLFGQAFGSADAFDIDLYENKNPQHHPFYLVLTPQTPCPITVSASGITAYSPVPNSVLDSLVIVKGAGGKLHMYGENSANIQKETGRGKLVHQRKINNKIARASRKQNRKK